ncbi:MAG: GNAT family N-acetyltransferase [Fulvivirga sp.]
MLKIRDVIPADMDEIWFMCRQHAEYEGAELSFSNQTKDNLASLIFTENKLTCWVAENEKGIIGYATCAVQYATWTASTYLYMDCLFLKQEARGLGTGSAFMRHIADFAIKSSISEIQWQTPSSNHAAIAFYTKLAVNELSKSRFIWAL